MEMMIVLLIVAVIAAASAPLVTKKMSSTGGDLDSSPWVYTGVAKSIAYNMDGSASSAIIGASKVPNGSTPKLYIESSGDEAQIGFGRAGSNDVMSFTMDTVNHRYGFCNRIVPNNSVTIGYVNNSSYSTTSGRGTVAIGTDISTGTPIIGAVAIGHEVTIQGNVGSTAIGHGVSATGAGSIAIGGNTADVGQTSLGAKASGQTTIAMGNQAVATNKNDIAIESGANAADNSESSIAIGVVAAAKGHCSIAIGPNTKATHNESVAIGRGAETKADNQIVLGNAATTVYIPGNLVVGRYAVLGYDNANTWTYLRYRTNSNSNSHLRGIKVGSGKDDKLCWGDLYTGQVGGFTSDRRLKNVGEKFTAGVNELSKLDFFHYTFKKDEAKTPHVGVIAQDLQKVFPDAVTKGDDGFLRIRWEEMFYAAINAIKELNTKITEIADNLMNTNSKVEEQAKIIEEQQNTIENQQKTIDSLIKRIESIEKKV